MILNDDEIRREAHSWHLIHPLVEENIQPASYDASIGKLGLFPTQPHPLDLMRLKYVSLPPGGFALVTTLERFRMGKQMVGRLGLVGSLGRKGLLLLAGSQIDPGFDGHLVIAIHNVAPQTIILDYQQPFLTVEFNRLSNPVSIPYPTRIDLQEGKIPQVERDKVTSMVGPSLWGVHEQLADLNVSVGKATARLGVIQAMLIGSIGAMIASLSAAVMSFYFLSQIVSQVGGG